MASFEDEAGHGGSSGTGGVLWERVQGIVTKGQTGSPSCRGIIEQSLLLLATTWLFEGEAGAERGRPLVAALLDRGPTPSRDAAGVARLLRVMQELCLGSTETALQAAAALVHEPSPVADGRGSEWAVAASLLLLSAANLGQHRPGMHQCLEATLMKQLGQLQDRPAVAAVLADRCVNQVSDR